MFRKEYENVFNDNERWNEIETTMNHYMSGMKIQHIFKTHHSLKDYQKKQVQLNHLTDLRVVGKFGDSVTTDHISPAGAIGKDTPAGKYLLEKGVQPRRL